MKQVHDRSQLLFRVLDDKIVYWLPDCTNALVDFPISDRVPFRILYERAWYEVKAR